MAGYLANRNRISGTSLLIWDASTVAPGTGKTYVNGDLLESDSGGEERVRYRRRILVADVNVGDVDFEVPQHISQQSLDERRLVFLHFGLRAFCRTNITHPALAVVKYGVRFFSLIFNFLFWVVR